MPRHSDRASAVRSKSSARMRPDWIPTRLEVALWFLGALAGVAAALYSVARFSSWWLALFVFVVVSHTLGHGLPDIITQPYRLARTVYVMLLPVVGTALLYVAYDLWRAMWLAVVLGLVLGIAFQVGLGSALLPESMEPRFPDPDTARHGYKPNSDVQGGDHEANPHVCVMNTSKREWL